MGDKILYNELSGEMINYLTILSGNDKKMNDLISKIYNYIEKNLKESYLIVYVTYSRIYFQITDLLLPKYVLLNNKEYSTNIYFSFEYEDVIQDNFKFMFDFILYELNEDNMNKLIILYKLKYIINQKIKNMYYSERNNDTYYIKTRSFGDIIYDFSIKTNGINDVYIKLNENEVKMNKLDDIIKIFNSYK